MVTMVLVKMVVTMSALCPLNTVPTLFCPLVVSKPGRAGCGGAPQPRGVNRLTLVDIHVILGSTMSLWHGSPYCYCVTAVERWRGAGTVLLWQHCTLLAPPHSAALLRCRPGAVLLHTPVIRHGPPVMRFYLHRDVTLTVTYLLSRRE